MERQVKEYGAKAFKLYNVRYDYGEPFPWRMDDRRIAYPIFEKALELGVTTIGVHKGVPLGPQPIESTQAWDMDGAAANFPDINFVIFHVGLPFIDEICWQLVRFPNLIHARDFLRTRARHRAREKQIRHRRLPGETAAWHMPDRRALNIQSRPT